MYDVSASESEEIFLVCRPPTNCTLFALSDCHAKLEPLAVKIIKPFDLGTLNLYELVDV